ncbi:MAG: hypothetical protein PPFGHCPK_00916 [Spiroplasma endosymbiont of Drosophila atripex]|nr:MAG: hypothetical protein PPFGHCPK_00200 [Spiroplasma endosymbiont of Drosophila atripex]WDA54015.1 MAG: hypothetical protein PPFGHCPK_00431 [Spiroplasma endosymbiont of Drosophila atripex]WDA54469.1 MAG: hypothetical protein PPFGHCPK_00916 [Spiroplasma endosymbiont of Drosophila atripex]
MNLWEFLKYGDKYNRYLIYTKDDEISYSANGNYWLTEHNDNYYKEVHLADWKVLSYKVDFDDGEIKVFISPDNQLMSNYNHFPDTRDERLNYD